MTSNPFDPFEPVYSNIGKLVVQHAEIEQNLYIFLVVISGLPTAQAFDVFSSDARIKRCKDKIKYICRNTGRNLDRIDEIFSQLTITSNIRNAFSHYQIMFGGSKIVIDTQIVYHDKGVVYDFEMKSFDEIFHDLEVAKAWINLHLIAEAGGQIVHQRLADAASSPFQYRPSVPFHTRRRTRGAR